MRLWTSAIIIALVIIVSFVLSVPHTRDILHAPTPPVVTTSVPTVALHDAFKKGMHTITGSLTAPNACTVVTARAAIVGSASSTQSLPAQTGILVAITMSKDTGMCLQLPAKINFQATVSAPARLPITATVNGVVATTTSS